MTSASGHRNLGWGGTSSSESHLQQGETKPACSTHTPACPLKTSKESMTSKVDSPSLITRSGASLGLGSHEDPRPKANLDGPHVLPAVTSVA